MNDDDLIAALEREVGRYESPVNDQQDEWATSARLAVSRLRAGADDDDRAAARALLERISGELS